MGTFYGNSWGRLLEDWLRMFFACTLLFRQFEEEKKKVCIEREEECQRLHLGSLGLDSLALPLFWWFTLRGI